MFIRGTFSHLTCIIPNRRKPPDSVKLYRISLIEIVYIYLIQQNLIGSQVMVRTYIRTFN